MANPFSAFRGISGHTPVTRRHSSSMFNGAFAKSVGGAMPTMADSNGSLTLSTNGGLLETVSEERFRGRAYSEGSPLLQDQQPGQTTSRYKTELCRPFEENGRCKYGDKCQFAHGKHELRHMVRHPKYKTELCRTYHTTGLCPYGPRCHFIHNTDDVVLASRQSTLASAVAAAPNHAASMPVPIANRVQSAANRPSNLQFVPLPQARNQGRVNGYSYSPPKVNGSPFGTPPGVFGPVDLPMLSPTSPVAGSTAEQAFNFGNAPRSPLDLHCAGTFVGVDAADNHRQATPPLSSFDVFVPPSQLDMSASDDAVFESPPTPPDSDRESESGSPQCHGVAVNSSRLPIFRCLSQSE